MEHAEHRHTPAGTPPAQRERPAPGADENPAGSPAPGSAAPTGRQNSAPALRAVCVLAGAAAVLSALALALSYLESFFPLALLVPLPGVKLGLANIVTLYALCTLGFSSAMCVLLARCALGALFAGNASALLFSLLGGVAALLMMALLRRAGRLSIFGISIAGAAAHNCGQVLAAVLTLGNAAPLAYLPFLLLVSLFTGALSGFIAALLFRAMKNTQLMQ